MNKKSTLLAAILFATSVVSAQTWSDNIAPIVFEHCATCHRDGGIGPFPLLSYQDAYDNAYNIAQNVSNHVMPPWPADPNYRHYVGENILTDVQIQTIQDWVNAGAPEGNPNNAPETPVFSDASALEAIDFAAVTPAYTSTAVNNDVYRTFVIDSDLAADAFIDGFEVIPGNPSIVHHVVVYYDPTDESLTYDANDPGPGFTTSGTGGALPSQAKFLTVWAPGKGPSILPFGFALRAEAGGHYLIEVHFPEGTDGLVEQTTVNVHYTNDTAPREVWLNPILSHFPPVLQQPFLYIPANSEQTFTEQYTVPIGITLFNTLPHMHLIGKTLTSWVETPDNQTIPLVKIPLWDFSWQFGYDFQQLVYLPAQSVLKAEAIYDNTINNPNNPNDPPQAVFAGESTSDEMMIVFFTYTYYMPGDENIVVDPALGMQEVQAPSSAFTVYPNPANSSLQLQTFMHRFGKVNASITDSNGKLVYSSYRTLAGGISQESIDISTLGEGLYIIRLDGENVHEAQRFIVAR